LFDVFRTARQTRKFPGIVTRDNMSETMAVAYDSIGEGNDMLTAHRLSNMVEIRFDAD
jgi:hypothetical protein